MSTATKESAPGAPATGVQILLDAEKEANRIVAQARAYRTERLRAARDSAAADLAALREARAADYAAVEARLLAELQADAEREAAEVHGQLEALRAGAADRVGAAARVLVDSVVNVRPAMHPNASV